MRSLADEIDGHSIAAEVRMDRQYHKGAFALLEGPADEKRFGIFFHESCSPVICFGKQNVLDAIELLYEEGFPGVLGFVDADFDRLLSGVSGHEGLVFSDYHDFDLDVVASPAFDRYLSEVSDPEKCSAFCGGKPTLDRVLEILKPISIIRYVNEKRSLGYRLKDIDFEVFIIKGEINVDLFIDHVSNRKFNDQKSKEALKKFVDAGIGLKIDLRQLTSGHDFCEALGMLLRGYVGDRHPAQCRRAEIEMHLRLTLNIRDIEASSLMTAVRNWELNHTPYRIFL